MYKWAVRRMIRRNVEALRRGDPAPLLAGYADDAVLVFPGTELVERGAPGKARHRGLPASLSRGGDRRGGPRHPRQRPTLADHGVRAVLGPGRRRGRRHGLREPGGPLRPDRVGKDRVPRGLRGHPEGGGVRPVPGSSRAGVAFGARLRADGPSRAGGVAGTRQLIVDGRQLPGGQSHSCRIPAGTAIGQVLPSGVPASPTA